MRSASVPSKQCVACVCGVGRSVGVATADGEIERASLM